MKQLVDQMKRNTEINAQNISTKRQFSKLLFAEDESSSSTESNNEKKRPKQKKIGFGQFIAQKMALNAVKKTWSQLHDQINFDKEISIKLREDVGFDIVLGLKVR